MDNVGGAGKTLAEKVRRESSVEVFEISQDILSVSQIVRYGLAGLFRFEKAFIRADFRKCF